MSDGDWICVYCGDFAGERDHLIPRNSGGLKGPLVDVCKACNMAAGDWTFDTFQHRKAYILIRRFVDLEVARQFREIFGARGHQTHREDDSDIRTVPDRENRTTHQARPVRRLRRAIPS